jgi:hypothetical protein
MPQARIDFRKGADVQLEPLVRQPRLPLVAPNCAQAYAEENLAQRLISFVQVACEARPARHWETRKGR